MKNGILLINKSKYKTSFSIVHQLRKITNIKKIGHSGTLDPIATGVMIMLVGKEFTKKANSFIKYNKQYLATIKLGFKSTTYDIEGTLTKNTTNNIPTLSDVGKAIDSFQGEIEQIPPMYSAKKIKGQTLYKLARKGIEVKRDPVKVKVQTKLISYNFPLIDILVDCSSGTYIRSIANDLGILLKTDGFLLSLLRTKAGPFNLKDCIDQKKLENVDLSKHFFHDNSH
jgi:tRNA pseudouridine55 synthase